MKRRTVDHRSRRFGRRVLEQLEPRLLLTGGTALSYAIVDTGQVKSYNATTEITAPAVGQAFYGQDAQFAGNQPSYTKSTDGLTVYDNNTGLTWQDSPDTNGNGSITASDKLNWTNAQARPAALNAAKYGGYSDWRLPTIKELYSLIDFRGTDPSGLSGSNTSGLTPFIDRTYFDFAYGDTTAGERIIDAQYASSTLYVGNTTMLFGVNFADGRIKGYGLTLNGADKTFFVQCVRGNASYGVNSFTNHGDGTVTDNATGLMWSQSDSGSGMNWQDALAWVQTKNAANYLGHNDWRLPNVKELQSIVDYSRSPATTGSAAINAVFNCTQIKNESNQVDYPWYWSGTTHAAYSGSGAAGAYLAFGRSTGCMNSTWVDVHGAGSQRSDPKSGSLGSYAYAPYGYYNSVAPQGDAVRIFNYVRLVRDAGATTPALGVSLGAASVSEGAGAAATAVTISRTANTSAALTVNLSSSDTSEATVPATATLAAGQSSVTVNLAAVDDTLVDGTQTVTITASAAGFTSGSGRLQVTDNDTATLAPEIQVLDGTTDITDGTGSVGFGSTAVGTAVSKTFTVKNLGTGNLTLTTPITVPAGFTITSSFAATTLAPNASTTFIVRMNATAAGSFSGKLSFANNDSNENPFDFTVSGTVAAPAPEIQVLNGTTDITDGSGSVAFGSTRVGAPANKTFTVKNLGTGTLRLNPPIFLPPGFALASGFGATALAPNASTTFIVRMVATMPGSYSGRLSFGNNDSNENPFDFTISGSVTAFAAASIASPTNVVGNTVSAAPAAKLSAAAVDQAFTPSTAVYPTAALAKSAPAASKAPTVRGGPAAATDLAFLPLSDWLSPA